MTAFRIMPDEDSFVATTPDGASLRAWSRGSGPVTLLLVSGLGGTGGFWKGTADALGERFRVLRFDQRGIGASSRGDAPCTIETLARDCLGVLDAAGVGRCMLLGHSTGGCIGQAVARLAPERLDGLILSASWLKPGRYMRALFEARRTVLETAPEAYAASAALLAYPPSWLEANWSVFESAVANAPASPEARRIVRERIDALLAFDGSPDLAALTQPCLVLGARDDMIVPAFLQEELARTLPQARLAMLEHGGHFFPLTRPEAFVAAVAGWMSA